MSRIGKKVIELPAKVKVTISGEGAVNAEGPKGKLSWTLPKQIKGRVEGTTVHIERSSEDRKVRALHGLSRALVNNIVTGVSTGEPASPEEVRDVAGAVGVPVLVGSGITPANLARYSTAHAFIVGSSVKKGGVWTNPLDADAVRAVADAFAELSLDR